MAKLHRKSLFEDGREPAGEGREVVTWRERLSSLKTAIWGLATPVIIIGGIYFGVYTPTESAAVLVVYAIVIAVVVKRVRWREVVSATMRSVNASVMILAIIFGAYIFTIVISQMRISANLVAFGQATGITALGWLGIIFIVLMLAGMFIDSAAMKLIFLPVFYAPAMAAGVNSLWLGVYWQFLSEIGLLTPPVGLNVFVIKGVTNLPLSAVFKGCTPFLIIMLLTLVIMYFFPQTVTWLPSTMR